MYKFFILGLFTLSSLFATLAAQDENTKSQLAKRLQGFIEAVNKGDAQALSSFWTQDAQFTNPTTGEVLKGKEEIAQYLQQREQEILERHLQFSFKPVNTTFPASDKAVVEGIVEITDKGVLIQRNARKVELVKQQGEWYINNVREIEVAPPPPVFSNLKDLEWMIGTWKDKDQDVTITSTVKWDKFKNFIIQNFKMDVYGVEAMEGIQIIGWDPVDETIRSWVYDSDGGFGEGTWSKKDKDWSVAMDYVLSDGNEGKATNIYSNINGKSYSYSSVDRSINDEALDNINPVTVEKE